MITRPAPSSTLMFNDYTSPCRGRYVSRRLGELGLLDEAVNHGGAAADAAICICKGDSARQGPSLESETGGAGDVDSDTSF